MTKWLDAWRAWRAYWVRIAFALSAGTGLGVGLFTFYYAKGYSYLTNNPSACANCHVMQSHYDGWLQSSHRSVAVCNDCHTPHALIPKALVKGRNGFWHSYYFTFGGFPEPIRITPANRRVTEEACRRCHPDIVRAIDRSHKPGQALECLQCHRSVGHPK